MKTITFILAAAALVPSGSLAFADTTGPQIETYGPATTNWGIPTVEDLSFAGFNNSLGTLTGVSISVSESATGTIQNQNNATVQSTIDSFITNQWKVYLPAALNSLPTIFGATLTDDQTDTLAASASGAVSAVSGTSGPIVDSSAPGDNLSAYDTAFVIGAQDKGSVNISASAGNGNAAYTDLGDVSVSVVYTYSPDVITAPEPATLALLGSALVGLGLSRRRRG